jgi:hypothetical protein
VLGKFKTTVAATFVEPNRAVTERVQQQPGIDSCPALVSSIHEFELMKIEADILYGDFRSVIYPHFQVTNKPRF